MEAQEYIEKRTGEILAEMHQIDIKYEATGNQVTAAERQMRSWAASKQKLSDELSTLKTMETSLTEAPVAGGE